MLEPNQLLALLVFVATGATIYLGIAPMFARDKLGPRMKSAALQRDEIRARERARLNAEKEGNKASLRSQNEAKGFVKSIVDGLNLKEALADDSTQKMLAHAGLRGQKPLFIFLACRVVLPFLFGIPAAIYAFVLPNEYDLMMRWVLTLGAAAIGFYGPIFFVRNGVGKRQLSIERAWPDALDLTLICVESGMSIEQSFRRVSEEIGKQSIELAEELVLTVAELSYLQDRKKAYDNLFERTGIEAVKAVTLTLVQAEKYGTPLGHALRVLSQENRDQRMNKAEKKAHALPPKMTVPMILFFLPVLFVVILTPAYITATAAWV